MTRKPTLLPDPYVFPAYPPPLPERDSGGPSYLVKTTLVEAFANGVKLSGETQDGLSLDLVVTFVAPGVVRVLLSDPAADSAHFTLALDQDNPPAVRITQTDALVSLTSDDATVQIALDPFGMSYFNASGQPVLSQNFTHRDATDRLMMLPMGLSTVDGQRAAFHDTFTAEPDEHFFGFGEKFTDFDKRGQELEMWTHNTYNTHSERAYKPVPFFISSRGYGIFVDSVTCTRFDMAASNTAVFTMIVPDAALDYYVIVGPDPKTIITRYAGLVSFPVMPPKWAFGMWMSGGFQQESMETLLARAQRLRDEDIPCDVLHIDPYWQRFGAWSDMEWDREAFPDPEGLISALREKHYQICLWENPYLGIESHHFDELGEKGFLLTRPDGEVYVLDLLDGYCPPMAILDLTHPDAVKWFQDQHRPLLKMGVTIFKTDFGESIPADAQAHNGMTGETLHNLFPLLYNDAVCQVMEEETGRPGMLWARSSFAGGQRHVAQWSADCECSFLGMMSSLRGGLSLGMCGHAFWGHDIGGFYTQPTPEVYIRWVELGMLSPLARAHGVTTRLPWDYGDEALRIFREYTRLRYRLLPYFYSYARTAVDTSLPMMRPMVLEFPDDPCTYPLDLQFMLGEYLLVAPIFNSAGTRSVYFPAGRWVDFWTHEVIEGPGSRQISAPLDVLPLYVRSGALIPTIELPSYITDEPFEQVVCDAYLTDPGTFTLYDTDGFTRIDAAVKGSTLSVEIDGVKNWLGLRVLPLEGIPGIAAVEVNGTTLPLVEELAWAADAPAGWMREANGTVRVVFRADAGKGGST